MEFTTISNNSRLNISSADNTTLGRNFSDRIPSIVFLILLGIIGSIGNAHALYIYAQRFHYQRRKPHGLKNPYVVLVLSLAVLDLFTCGLLLPTDDVYLTQRFTIFSESMCKLHRYLQYSIHISSCCHITFISIHYWRMMCRPHSWQINGRVAIKCCIILHILSALACLPMVFVAGYANDIIDGKKGLSCVIDDEKHAGSVAFIFGMVVLAVFGVSCFITICITNAAVIIARFRKRGLNADNKKSDKDKEKARKTAAILSSLTVLFLIAYLPYLGIAVYRVFTKESRSNSRGPHVALRILAIKLPFLNNVVNPIVYGFRDEEFRHKLLQIYPCMQNKCKKPNESSISLELT